MRQKILAKAFLGALTILAVAPLAVASPLHAASTFNPGTYVYDDFETFVYQPNPGAYWWVDGQGTLPDGSWGRVRNENNCDLQTCISHITEGENGFMRIEGGPTTTVTNYTNVNFSEVVDGADGDPVYGGQTYHGPWNPTFLHPVVLEARVRFSPNFKKDGTGGAKGTAGIWLWNNPFSKQASDPFAIHDGIGFSWASVDSDIAQGLNITVVKGTLPVFFLPVLANINMNDWNTYKFVWSKDILGNQLVTFYINNTLVGLAPMVVGLTTMQDLGLEIWIDNQAFQLETLNGSLVQIPESRYLDLDYVKIYKQ